MKGEYSSAVTQKRDCKCQYAARHAVKNQDQEMFRSSEPFTQLSSITKSQFLKDIQGNKNRILCAKLGNFQAVFLDY